MIAGGGRCPPDHAPGRVRPRGADGATGVQRVARRTIVEVSGSTHNTVDALAPHPHTRVMCAVDSSTNNRVPAAQRRTQADRGRRAGGMPTLHGRGIVV